MRWYRKNLTGSMRLRTILGHKRRQRRIARRQRWLWIGYQPRTNALFNLRFERGPLVETPHPMVMISHRLRKQIEAGEADLEAGRVHEGEAVFDALLEEGLASPVEEWTPEVRQAMAREALAVMQAQARATGANQMTDEAIEREIAAVRESTRQGLKKS